MKMDNKNISNNKINAPYEYYKNVFSQKDPLSMSNSSNVEFSEGRFCFRMLSKEIFLLWPDMNAVYADGNDAGKSKAILLARLVMQGRITVSYTHLSEIERSDSASDEKLENRR